MFAERDDLDDALLARPVERQGEPRPMIVIGASGTGKSWPRRSPTRQARR
jgi:hypothetical protein